MDEGLQALIESEPLEKPIYFCLMANDNPLPTADWIVVLEGKYNSLWMLER